MKNIGMMGEMEVIKNLGNYMICNEYASGKETIDELLEKLNKTINDFDSNVKRDCYEEELGAITVKIEIVYEILKLKKLKENKQDALKVYKLYLKQVEELGKLWE